jgi:hypothetical protein
MKWLFAGGMILAVSLLATAALVPLWGERHTANPTKSLLVTTQHPLEQQFKPEHGVLTQIAVWLVPDQELPTTGGLLLEVTTGNTKKAAVTAFADVQADGLAVFSFSPALSIDAHTTAAFRLLLQDTTSPIKIGYQNDGTKYPDGSVTGAAGDSAFQVHYNVPALPQTWFWVGLLLAAAGWIVWQYRFSPTTAPPVFYTRRDWIGASAIGIAITLFFDAYLVFPSGLWNAPGDFVKDVAYIQASHQAFTHLSWPTWSQLTCGGLPLLGNPESNALSLGSVLAFFTTPHNALLWLVSIEAGIAATGAFLLARAMGLSTIGSTTASMITVLGGAYSYRLMEGFTMTGGAVAFMPWVLLGLFHYLKRGSWPWLWVAGTALGLIFLRGEVHILAGFVFLLGLFVLALALSKQSWKPVLAFITLGCIALLWASPKLIAYAAHSSFFIQDLHPYVTLLTKDGWLGDVFFKLYPSDKTIAVLHGKEIERWGNFGAYLGVLPVLLALVGVLSKNKYRWWLLAGALVLLVISEGTLYEYGLRFVPQLGILLRLPTRLLSITVILVGLLAGMGIDRLARPLKLAFVVAVTLDLAVATGTVFLGSVWNRSTNVLPSPTQPTVHQAYSSQLLASGYLLPQLCADFNAQPDFADTDTVSWPFATMPVRLTPDTIVVSGANQKNEAVFQTRFSDRWQATGATTLEGPDNTLLVATTHASPASVRIYYADSLTRPEAVLFLTMLVTTVGLGLFPVGLEYFRKLVR